MTDQTPVPHGLADGAAIAGCLSIHPRGFGFIELPDSPAGEPVSVFVPPPELDRLMSGDMVRARLVAEPDGRWSARSLELTERRRQAVFGTVASRAGRPVLVVDPEVARGEWPLAPGSFAPSEGDSVIAAVRGDRLEPVERLAPDADRSWYRILVRHELRDRFQRPVLAQARTAAARPHELGSRRDLREIPTITVDSESTRDIDDAVSVLAPAADGALRLLVSIADVSEFVPADGPLDREARARGTSVYLPDRVLPMLPEELSCEALSLLQGQDRCCLTVELRIDPEGTVTAVDVYESLIRSVARVTYDDLAAYLERMEVVPALEPVRESLPLMRAAAARLSIGRLRRGGVQFSRDEARLKIDPSTGTLAGIETVRTTGAHHLIERFMVAANEAIAAWLNARGIPALYRIHAAPPAARAVELETLARNTGFEAGFGGRLTPTSLAVLESQIIGSRSEAILRSAMLRVLGPAAYTVKPGPHFGLAAPLYLHFTSPIRRYADLVVHRAVKGHLSGVRWHDPLDAQIGKVAAHLNDRSDAASRAERDRGRVLSARWLAGRTGESHTGRVVRVRPFGLQVQLDAPPVEGLVPADSLPGGPYRLDASGTALVGPSRSFVVGTSVALRIGPVDVEEGRIEFELEASPGPRGGRSQPKGTRSRSPRVRPGGKPHVRPS